ncbi:hypothetical protein WICPIJ_005232, partial [Wickerhamomyces pijperi]
VPLFGLHSESLPVENKWDGQHHDSKVDDSQGNVSVFGTGGIQPQRTGEGEDTGDRVVDDSDTDHGLQNQIRALHDVTQGNVTSGTKGKPNEGQPCVDDRLGQHSLSPDTEHQQPGRTNDRGDKGKVQSELRFQDTVVTAGHPQDNVIGEGARVDAPKDRTNHTWNVHHRDTDVAVVVWVVVEVRVHGGQVEGQEGVLHPPEKPRENHPWETEHSDVDPDVLPVLLEPPALQSGGRGDDGESLPVAVHWFFGPVDQFFLGCWDYLLLGLDLLVLVLRVDGLLVTCAGLVGLVGGHESGPVVNTLDGLLGSKRSLVSVSFEIGLLGGKENNQDQHTGENGTQPANPSEGQVVGDQVPKQRSQLSTVKIRKWSNKQRTVPDTDEQDPSTGVHGIVGDPIVFVQGILGRGSTVGSPSGKTRDKSHDDEMGVFSILGPVQRIVRRVGRLRNQYDIAFFLQFVLVNNTVFKIRRGVNVTCPWDEIRVVSVGVLVHLQLNRSLVLFS